MLCGFLLLLYELPHEVPKELRPATVPGFGGLAKLAFQSVVDPEGEGCLIHGCVLMCCKMGTT